MLVSCASDDKKKEETKVTTASKQALDATNLPESLGDTPKFPEDVRNLR